MTHPEFRRKLEAIGFGVFIPVFFVTSGVRFDLDALSASASTLAHGADLPRRAAARPRAAGAALPRPLVRRGGRASPALLQATSLPFIVAATAIGLELGSSTPGNAAALIAAGLLSVVLFPAAALTLLKRDPATRRPHGCSFAAGNAARRRGDVAGLDVRSHQRCSGFG